MNTPVIALERFGVKLGKRWILQDLDAELRGRAIGLLGPNGAGKTTLIHTLLGFHGVDAGSASMLGHDVRTSRRQLASLVGYMPERDAFVAGMTGIHFVRLMGEVAGLPPQVALERAHEALFFVGLGEARYRPLESYSLGMKQMAKLAQALVHGPRLIFLDEPTNGLDPSARQRMLELIGQIRSRGETSIVLSSHLLKDGRIATVCDLEAERRANRQFLELEVRGGNGHFAEAAAALGCETLVHSKRRLKLLLPPEIGVQHLYRIAADQGVQIRRLHARRDSLEDIFLKAMEERDGSP